MTGYERNERFERLIGITEQLQLVVDEIADEHLDTTGVEPNVAETTECKVHLAQIASFMAGHLAAAIHIIQGSIADDYPGLKAANERDMLRRLLRALDETKSVNP